jgi:hypothetical protein
VDANGAADRVDVLLDEGVGHDGLFVLPQDILKCLDVLLLVGIDEVGHGHDLRVIAVAVVRGDGVKERAGKWSTGHTA